MTCSTCYPITLTACSTELKIPASLAAGQVYFVKLEDKFGNAYTDYADSDADGNLIIDMTGFPEGLTNPNVGSLVLTIFGFYTSDYSAATPITFDEQEYTCIELQFQKTIAA
jgi:hypothetical protein